MGKVVARFNLHMFSVVIVTGGKDAVESVELLYTNGTHRCSLPDLPQGRYYPTQVGLVTCGSTDDAQTQIKSCVTFSDGSWKKSHTLAGGGRAGTVGWASPQGVLLFGGWIGAPHSSTTELLLENGNTKPGFRLAYKTYAACSIEEEESVVITGGYDGHQPHGNNKKVTKYHMDGNSKPLPNLISGRYWHACGLFINANGDIVSCSLIF